MNVHLANQWNNRYEDIQKNIVMQDYDSGRFWAGLFIARLLKSVSEKRNRSRRQGAASISEYNYKQKYSKMLKQLEAEQEEEEKRQ